MSSQILSPQKDSAISPATVATSLRTQIDALGDWFHNIDLNGERTAPGHFLGDYPQVKWKRISSAIPAELNGASVLDVGCNAGFYCVEMKKRGAGRVLGVDLDERYLAQAGFVRDTLNLDIEFQKMCVYDVDQIAGQFDYVLFMGVFYHLRYPLLGLDRVVKKVKQKLLFQTMLRGSNEIFEPKPDYDFWDKDIFERAAFPAAYFIEKSYSNDYTNWFIPNRSGAEAMLRSSGLKILAQPEAETWLCEPDGAQRDGEFIADLELSGRL
jgi:tRNA (mo5U34)-methyltransferase